MWSGANQFLSDVIGGVRDVFVARENRRSETQITNQANTAAVALAANDRARLQMLIVGGLGLVGLMLVAKRIS